MPKEIAPVCHFPQITDALDFFFVNFKPGLVG